IYFYLHFQYNAWFILALCGVLFYLFEKYQLTIPKKEFRQFFLLLNGGLILSLFLSALWIEEPPLFLYLLGGAGAILQLLGFLKFFQILKAPWQILRKNISGFIRFLLTAAAILLLGK